MSTIDRRAGRIALLIDADNLSADVIEQAIEHLLQNHGAIHFRRAYCSPQKAMELMELFRRHAIRPMVNVPTGKNSTDIALAVDAVDLALTERPEVVVIASSDSDYAPLAQRLREKGCRVLGIGQAGKTGSESPLAYDGFIDLAHRGSRARPEGVRGRSGGASSPSSLSPPPSPPPLPTKTSDPTPSGAQAQPQTQAQPRPRTRTRERARAPAALPSPTPAAPRAPARTPALAPTPTPGPAPAPAARAPAAASSDAPSPAGRATTPRSRSTRSRTPRGGNRGGSGGGGGSSGSGSGD